MLALDPGPARGRDRVASIPVPQHVADEVGKLLESIEREDLPADVEAAMQPIFGAMNARYRDKETARRAHQSKYGPTPRRPRAPRRDDRK